jgi:ABC-2 type transport system ATP-binding protein
MVVEAPETDRYTPDASRWVVETFGVRKRFAIREGLPVGFGWGQDHWLVSSVIKYRKKVKWFQALDGVDLKIARGEMLGLLGPNGAGKTTFIKCLATLLGMDGGEAYVNGFNVRTQPDDVRLSMNLVGSGHWIAFDWAMTLTQNLHFFGSLYGLNKSHREERIAYTLSLLGLTHLAKRTPRIMSSGERQRMLLAKGFMVRTPLFLLDEPTVGLDPLGSLEVREFIRKEFVGKSDRSGILTTHRMVEAEALCRRIAIMNKGRIVAEGTTSELKRLAGQPRVMDIRGTSIPAEAIEAVKRTNGVRTAAVSPVGSESVEESLRVHCENIDAVTDRVVDTLRSHGATVRSVEFQEPTLEDTFLALTDRRLT